MCFYRIKKGVEQMKSPPQAGQEQEDANDEPVDTA